MFSRVEPSGSRHSRKRRKVQHSAEPAGEPSTRPSATTDTMAQTHEQADANDATKGKGPVEESLESMRHLITCKICQHYLTEPYGLACGHTYCYVCLDTWLGTQQKNTCPECRTVVKQQPVPSLIIREMVQVFSTKQELLLDGETVQDQKLLADDAANKVAKDKNETGLFRGIFASGRSRREPIYDHDDNVLRCPACFHEIEDGECSHCGLPVEAESSYYDDDLDVDIDGFDEDDIFDVDRRQAMEERIRRDMMRDIERARLSISISEADSDDDEDETEMDGFVVPDDQAEEDSSSNSSSVASAHVRHVDRAGTPRHEVVYDSDDDDDSTSDTNSDSESSHHSERRVRHQARQPRQQTRTRLTQRVAPATRSRATAEAHVVLSSDEDDEPPTAQRRKDRPTPRRPRTRVVIDLDSEPEPASRDNAQGSDQAQAASTVRGDNEPVDGYSDLDDESDDNSLDHVMARASAAAVDRQSDTEGLDSSGSPGTIGSSDEGGYAFEAAYDDDESE